MPLIEPLKKLTALLFLVACLHSVPAAAQEEHMVPLKNTDTLTSLADTAHTLTTQRDLPEAISRLFCKNRKEDNKPFVITSKPVFSVVPAIGYTLVTRLAAVISGNVIFKVDSMARISTITASATYTQNNQFYSPIKANISTKNNRYNFIGDVQFYKYPQVSYGLGSNSPVSNANPMDYRYFRFNAVALRKISGSFYAGLGYTLDHRWNISEKGIKDGAESDYSKYGRQPRTTSSGFNVTMVYDSRDNPINSTKGAFAVLQWRNNMKFLGSNEHWRSLLFDVRKYIKLSPERNSVLALWSFNWLVINGHPPYLDLPSIGWDVNSATGRGYIQSRFRGAQMLYQEAEYRFQLTRNGLLGGVLFGNVSTFSGKPGSKLERMEPAFGPGLRIKLNKKSRTNIAIDYGFGTQGSKGLFINVGEVF